MSLCQQNFLLPYTQKARLEIAGLDHLYSFLLCPGYIQILEVCILLWLSIGLWCINQFHCSEDIYSYSGWYQWPLDHTSVQTRCRPKVMEGTIPVFIMLGNTVEIAAEGKGRAKKVHEHWFSTHPICSMGAVSGLLVSELWNIVTQKYCRCTLHVWTTDTIPMRQSALAIGSSWYYLAGHQFLIAFETCSALVGREHGTGGYSCLCITVVTYKTHECVFSQQFAHILRCHTLVTRERINFKVAAVQLSNWLLCRW